MAVLCHRQLMDPALQPLLFVVQLQPSTLSFWGRTTGTSALLPWDGIGFVFQPKLQFPSSQIYTWEQCKAEVLLTSKMRGIIWVNPDDSITREGTEQGEAQAALHGEYP